MQTRKAAHLDILRKLPQKDSTQLAGLTVRREAMNCWEENLRGNLDGLRQGDVF